MFFLPLGLVVLSIKNQAPWIKVVFICIFSYLFSCSQCFPFLIISCAVATCGLRFQYPIIVIQQRALARPILETHCLFPTTMPKTFSFSLSLSVVFLVLFPLIIRSTSSTFLFHWPKYFQYIFFSLSEVHFRTMSSHGLLRMKLFPLKSVLQRNAAAFFSC